MVFPPRSHPIRRPRLRVTGGAHSRRSVRAPGAMVVSLSRTPRRSLMTRSRTPHRLLLGLAVCATAALAATVAVRPAAAGSGQPDDDNLFPNVAALVVTDDAVNPDAPVVVGSGA